MYVILPISWKNDNTFELQSKMLTPKLRANDVINDVKMSQSTSCMRSSKRRIYQESKKISGNLVVYARNNILIVLNIFYYIYQYVIVIRQLYEFMCIYSCRLDESKTRPPTRISAHIRVAVKYLSNKVRVSWQMICLLNQSGKHVLIYSCTITSSDIWNN